MWERISLQAYIKTQTKLTKQFTSLISHESAELHDNACPRMSGHMWCNYKIGLNYSSPNHPIVLITPCDFIGPLKDALCVTRFEDDEAVIQDLATWSRKPGKPYNLFTSKATYPALEIKLSPLRLMASVTPWYHHPHGAKCVCAQVNKCNFVRNFSCSPCFWSIYISTYLMLHVHIY